MKPQVRVTSADVGAKEPGWGAKACTSNHRPDVSRQFTEGQEGGTRILL